ncbi:MAG TPA: hypothetical protein ENH29_00705 [Bacteroidetes bacterium]|nr:hypothetical protein [Bacteroidota bacterium]
MRHKIISLLLLVLLSLPVTLVNARQQPDGIKEDIHIMEAVLDKLLQASRDQFFTGRNIKGFYFDHYGLLFTVNLKNQFQLFSIYKNRVEVELENLEKSSTQAKEKKSKEAKNRVVVATSPGSRSFTFSTGKSMNEEDFKKWTEKLDKKIQTFMSSYVDLSDYLKKDDKISVVVFLNRSSAEQPKARIYRVLKKDVAAHRTERLSDKAFAAKISRQFVSGDNHAEEIEVMSTIFETALTTKHRSRYLFGNNVNGIFLKDLGVMFSFGNHFFSNNLTELIETSLVPTIEELDKSEKRVAIIKEKTEKRNKKYRDSLSGFEEKIIKILGTYGAALRFLPDKQSVFVLFGTSGFTGRDITNVMIRIKKADLLAYSRKQIGLENLKKRVQIVEY